MRINSPILLVKLKVGRWAWPTSEGLLSSITYITNSGFSSSFWVGELSGRFVTRARELPVSSVSWWMARAESVKSVLPFPYMVKNIPGTRPHLKSIAKSTVSVRAWLDASEQLHILDFGEISEANAPILPHKRSKKEKKYIHMWVKILKWNI